METVTTKPKIWNDSFKIGVPLIDEQHAMFFEIYESFIDVYENKDHDPHEEALHVINELVTYIEMHFRVEEELLAVSDYPDIDQHIYEHDIFIKKIEEFIISHEYQNQNLFRSILDFMKKWFLNHIMQTDKEFGSHVKSYLDSQNT